MVHAVANAFIERNVMDNMITLQTCFCHVMRAILTISVKTDYEVSAPRFGAPAVKVRCGILFNKCITRRQVRSVPIRQSEKSGYAGARVSIPAWRSSF